MRFLAFLSCAALAACVTTASPPATRTSLTPTDAATGMIAGGPLTMAIAAPSGGGGGEDPLVAMTLTRADGRVLAFNEANHAPDELRAQSAGGALAQVMGLFGEERPTLYAADAQHNNGAPFLCGPDGPAYVGFYSAPDGTVTMVGLKSAFEFETLSDGSSSPLPYSPDHVCARLHFRRG